MAECRPSKHKSGDERHGEKRRSTDSSRSDTLDYRADSSAKKTKTESPPLVYDQPAPLPSAKEQIERAKARKKARQMLEDAKTRKQTVETDQREDEYVTPVDAQHHKQNKLAQVFNQDSDSDTEEMPLEAKMKMRNIGRDTPTAAGPNSFGKGSLGFTNIAKLREKQFMETAEALNKGKK